MGAGRRQPRPHGRGAQGRLGADERARRGDQRARRVRRPDLVPGLRHVQRRRHLRDEGDARRPARQRTSRSSARASTPGCGARRSSRRRSASRSRARTAATRRSRASSTSSSRTGPPRAAGPSAGRPTPARATRRRCRSARRWASSPLGQGKIRILGALLPQPSTEYDHPLGIEPYAVTYTGYILFCNLVDCQYERKSRPALPNEPGAARPGQRRLRRAA